MRKTRIMDDDFLSIWRAYRDFLVEKQAEGLSKRTLETYDMHIKHFLSAYGEEPTENMTKDMYNTEILSLQSGGRSDVTVTSYCRSIRVFFYWCMEKGYTKRCSLVLPRYETHVKEIYTNSEIATLLEKPKRRCTEVEYLTWVFINIVMATGLRLSSVLDLRVRDYVPEESVVYIQHTKQKVGQKIQINKELAVILDRYIDLFELKDDYYLFCLDTGERLKKRTMQDFVAKYNRSRGVNKTSIHLMRHTFAVNFYTNTRDIYALKMVMGHTLVSTTEHYLQSLGITIAISEAYNPQVIFSNAHNTKTRRRGKI